MEILFIIAVVSCLSLVWAVISIVRHVRHDRRRQERALARSQSAQPTFAETLLRSSYDDPPVGGQAVRPHPREDLAAGRAAAANRMDGQRRPVASERSGERFANGTDGGARPDWRYYNRNMGDLSDPDANRSPQRRSGESHGRK